MNIMHIPFNKPYWGRQEEQAVVNALRHTLGTGDGPYTEACEKKLQKLTGAKYILPVTSCTHGLELALSAYDLKKGDEVIVPSFTMTSTANAVVLNGATPVFADIDEMNFNIDPDDVKRCITRKTRGMIIVHYAGMACRMEELYVLAKKNKMFIVEDAAHTIGATYKGKALGNVADIGVYSFHGTKNVSCGEGGAVMTNNMALFKKMEIYRANGTNRNAFIRGEVAKYSWVTKGSSYFLSDILASILSTQLDKITEITKERRRIAQFYNKAFAQFTGLIGLPVVPEGTKPNYHIYAITFSKPEHRDSFIQFMKSNGIDVSSHYVPLHSSVMGKSIVKEQRKLPITDRIARTLVRLPIYPGMTKRELSYIVSHAKKAFRSMQF